MILFPARRTGIVLIILLPFRQTDFVQFKRKTARKQGLLTG